MLGKRESIEGARLYVGLRPDVRTTRQEPDQPNPTIMILTDLEIKLNRRFWSKIAVAGEDNCWLWLAGKKKPLPYGNFGVDGEMVGAHRVMYEMVCGPIPKGMCVLHHCDNPPCVNPKHLFLGTRKSNVDDMISKGRFRLGPNSPVWKVKIVSYPIRGFHTKLTPQQEADILDDPRTGKQLAPIYGVNRATIDRARKRQRAIRRGNSPWKLRDGRIPV